MDELHNLDKRIGILENEVRSMNEKMDRMFTSIKEIAATLNNGLKSELKVGKFQLEAITKLATSNSVILGEVNVLLTKVTASIDAASKDRQDIWTHLSEIDKDLIEPQVLKRSLIMTQVMFGILAVAITAASFIIHV